MVLANTRWRVGKGVNKLLLLFAFVWVNSHLSCERLSNVLFSVIEPVILAHFSRDFKTQNGVR